MKRILLVVFVVCLLAGQASAGMYTLTTNDAMMLKDVWYSDAPFFSGGLNFMPFTSPTISQFTYGPSMQGAVGFFGSLDDTSGDYYAEVKMGDPGADLELDLSAYSGYNLFVANDNRDFWEVQLHMTVGGTEYVTEYTEMAAFTSTTLVLDFVDDIDDDDIGALNDVTDIGFYIRGYLVAGVPGDFGVGYPSDPAFYHVSVIPVPSAVILGVLGLGVVGWKLRKYA